ncbi:conserved Plasmodium protein, unknown function [Plasmodium chabaudi chabaudi]|uniref:Uncharacterized protein n=1 Tax=Plasmodium chabaudi chabaudi TaxID=31271 RepID=A0A1D3S4D4_PLACU|nr:conserved Plasmodium protein, unknown function [Plasmodium chabaudi chabaudi]
MILNALKCIVNKGNTSIFNKNFSIFEIKIRCMKNKRRGLKEQPRKKPLDIEKKIRNPDKYEEKMHFDNLSKGELYLPESCKGKKLAMLCNRLYYFDINDEELLERYAQRAIVIANNMSTKEMSLILNTMRKFNHKNVNLLETFAKYIPSKLHKSVPQDISLMLNAYAHFNYVDNNLFNRICEEIPHKIPYFEPSHISSIINAFYKLNIKDKIIIYDMIDELVDRIDEFDSKSLTNLINSLSKMNYKNIDRQVVWIKLFEGVKKIHKDLNVLEIVLIINGFCKKNIKNKNIYNFLNECLNDHIFQKKSIDDTNAYLLCTVAQSFAKIKFYSKDFFNFVFDFFSEENNYTSLDTQHFSQLIYAFSIFNLDDKKKFIDTFIKIVLNKIQNKRNKEIELNEQTLSTISYCLAKLKIRDMNFFVSLSSYLINEKIKLSAQSLSLICYSYSKLKIKSEILFYILSIQIFEKMHTFTKQGLALILNSYANLKIFNVKLFSLINKYLKLYVDTFTNSECLLICKHYEGALKSLTDEEASVNAQSNKSSLVKINTTKQELDNFVQVLKNKIHIFEKNKELKGLGNDETENDSMNKFEDTKQNELLIELEDGKEENEDEFFSIFNQNDIISGEEEEKEKDNHNNDDEKIKITKLLLNMDDEVVADCDDNNPQKKEDTLNIYEKMFLTNPKEQKNAFEKNNIPIMNEQLNKNLSSMLNKQNKEIEEKNKAYIKNKNATKSLLELMASNKPPKINYEKENLIKSAEQTETEFIKAYINEQKESTENPKIGRHLNKRKKMIQKILSKNFEPIDNIDTLQKKWTNEYISKDT